MESTVLCVLVLYALVLCVYAGFASKHVRSVRDFFSYRIEHTPKNVIATFEASNASFMTAFLAIFLYSLSLGYATIWIPIGFCAGIILYARVFLPRKAAHLRLGRRYPSLLEKSTNSRWVRTIASLFIILSLWLFFFAEIQGLLIFLGALFADNANLRWALPFFLVAGMAAYIYAGGFQAVVLTDRVQMWLIRIGTGALFFLVITYFIEVKDSLKSLPETLPTFFSLPSFIVQTLIGFAFAQLLYYDNWLRLSLYLSDPRRAMTDDDVAKVVSNLRRLYTVSAFILFAVYLAPVAVGILQLRTEHTDVSPSTLIAFFHHTWDNGLFSRVLVVLVFLQFFSALVSTADTYVVSAVATLTEDLFLQDITSEKAGRPLQAVRLIAAVFAVSVLPFVYSQVQFTMLFDYMFYSANGFVGPLCAVVWHKQLNRWFAAAAILLGFLIPTACWIFSTFNDWLQYSGMITALLSLLLAGVGVWVERGRHAGAIP